jgi:hypothetical protein
MMGVLFFGKNMKKICRKFGTTLGDFKNYLYFCNRIPVQGET